MFRILIVISFILYAWNPQVFERKFLINEVICIYGLMVFICNWRFFISLGPIKALLPFVFVLTTVWVFSFFLYENSYVYFRRLSILYSIFALFAIFSITPLLLKSRFKWLLLFPVQKVNLIFCYMYLSSVINIKYFWLFSLASIFLYTMIFGGSTAIFSVVASYFILYGGRKFWMPVVISMLVYSFFYYWLQQYYSGSAGYMSDIFDYMDSYSFLSIDGNLTVRLFMWKEILSNVLPASYGMGQGFGTILFPENIINFLGLTQQLHNDDQLEYTLSPHNSYMFILAKTGIIGLSALLYFFVYLFQDFQTRRLLGISSEFERAMFSIFVAYSVGAGLNVVIESPIHSGLYWGVFGMYLWTRASGYYEKSERNS